jgi:hypothetical protein
MPQLYGGEVNATLNYDGAYDCEHAPMIPKVTPLKCSLKNMFGNIECAAGLKCPVIMPAIPDEKSYEEVKAHFKALDIETGGYF